MISVFWILFRTFSSLIYSLLFYPSYHIYCVSYLFEKLFFCPNSYTKLMQCSYQNKLVFFMILMNYYSLISPSPSLSASSIISCNYSSAIVSPNYLATLFKFFNDTFPVLSSSKSLKAFRISSLGSLSLIFVVISSIKSANSITPFPSLSTSAISFFTSYFLGSKPSALMATLSSFESMYPEHE